MIRAFTGERHLRGRWLTSPRRPGDPHQAGDAKGSRRAVGVQAVRLIQAMTRHPALSDHEHMRTSHDQRGPGRMDAPAAMMLDDLLDQYVDWRGSARAVEDRTRDGRLRPDPSASCGSPHTQPRSTRSKRQPPHMPRRRPTSSGGCSARSLIERFELGNAANAIRAPATGRRSSVRRDAVSPVTTGWQQALKAELVEAQEPDPAIAGGGHMPGGGWGARMAPLAASELGEGADKLDCGSTDSDSAA